MKRRAYMPDEPSTGLVTSKGEQVPLLGVSIEARVRDLVVQTTLSQRFRNVEDKPIEAVYSFPMGEDSAVCGFEARIGDRLVKGQIEEREKAFEDYDDAMKRGDSAFLLDQYRPDIFLVSVGRLMPGEEASVTISHVSRAESWDRGLRLRIPTTISPRYIPADKLANADPAELDAVCPPTIPGGVPYGLSLSVDIAAGSAIRTVSCPSHPVEVSVKGRKASVSIMGDDVQLDSDFVLEIELEKPSISRCVACREGDGYALMLRLKPEVTAHEQAARDVIFVIDRSGSMGDSIREAKAALLLGLKSLREGDRFNVIGFGTTHQQVFCGLTDYNQESVERAINVTSSWDADLGGTEILEPLEKALKSTDKGHRSSVFLLTDGQVGNEADVIALAGKYRGRCRIFSFGIGQGASGTLVKGAARASGGSAEFIYPGERIEPRVMRQMARSSWALGEGARLDWGSLDPEATTPSDLQAFGEGDDVVAFCRVRSLEKSAVRLVAADSSVLAECVVDIGDADLESDDTIALMMARGLIDDLETGGCSDTGSTWESRKEKAAGDRILDIALRNHLVSSKTSFVAVETRESADATSPAVLRRVPVALTRGWGNLLSSAHFCMTNMGMDPAAASSPGPQILQTIWSSGMSSLTRRRAEPSALAFPRHDKDVRSDKAKTPADPFLDLVSLQRVDGSWEMDQNLARLAGSSVSSIGRALKAPGEVIGTLVGLYLLWTKHSGREDEWRLLAGKAIAWLEKQGIHPTPPPAGLKLEDWLRSIR